MVTLLAYRAPRLPVSTAHGRPRHVHRANHASRFPKSGQTALYVSLPLSTLVTSPKLSNDQFVACTSPNNAASIIAATGIQTDIANNCTSLGNTSFPFSAPNNTIPEDGGNNGTQGINGTSSASGQVVSSTRTPSLTLPPTTTTLSPEQASSLFSLASGPNSPSIPSNAPGSNNLGGNEDGALPVILLTSAPVSSPTRTPTPTTPSSVRNTSYGGY
jgi:hypothetical protein